MPERLPGYGTRAKLPSNRCSTSMQFCGGGPEVPERLLEKHEDGEVVLFCGAGISYPAELPGFSQLVEQIYRQLKPQPNSAQQAMLDARQFDRAIELLDKDVVGGRQTVRTILAEILTPREEQLAAPEATATHEALLTLAQSRKQCLKLITTNFDRLFEIVIAKAKEEDRLSHIQRCQAPLLPVPKKSRLNHLVYLHGLLPEATNQDQDLNDLIISSGDFGLAYLTEGWAARFISELFRNFTVCFIGYSIDDPVLRYMIDALAADKLRGESLREMFAFGGYDDDKKDEQANEWEAKGVTPILYCKQNNHEHLHKTLQAWAVTYRNNIDGKEAIISQYGRLQPRESTAENNFVDRILWALSDPNGVPATYFANLEPIPPLDWLQHLSKKNLLQQTDLVGFEAPNRTQEQQRIVNNLVPWLIRYLNQPDLLLWLTEQAGNLNQTDFIRLRPQFVRQIESHFEQLTPPMRTLWGLLLAERVKSPNSNRYFYGWKQYFESNGLTVASRFKLRNLLTPRVLFRRSRSPYQNQEASSGSAQIRKLVDWEIVLQVNHLRSGLNNFHDNQRWIQVLPHLLSDFSNLLKDAMDLMRELDGANNRSDWSYFAQPSIAKHQQNNERSDTWAILIELNRDAWLETARIEPEQARRAAEDWVSLPYPVFRRLAFFAATQGGEVVPAEQALSWLLADDCCWLWSPEVKREAIRLLVALAGRLEGQLLNELEQAILDGPPPGQYRDDITDDEKIERTECAIWFRLAKIAGSGGTLGQSAQEKLDDLRSRHPEWQLRADEGDEFPFFRIDDPSEIYQYQATPRRPRSLLDWVKRNPQADHWKPDDWSKLCKTNLRMTAWVLCSLAKVGTWPVDRWCQALLAWSQEEDLIKKSWHYIAPVLVNTPHQELQLQSLANDIGWWLGYVAKVIGLDDKFFVRLCERLLEFEGQNHLDDDSESQQFLLYSSHEAESEQGVACQWIPRYSDENLVSQAANHPIGRMIEALLNWWFREQRYDGGGLTENIKTIFSKLFDDQSNDFQRFWAGRIVLAEHAVVLFRVDLLWAEEHLLPLFDWQNDQVEACGTWQGFLCSPRLYRPFMELTKTYFLDTARHYSQLGNIREQYARFLTSIIIHKIDIYTEQELSQAMGHLPAEGLQVAATAFAQTLEGVDEQNCIQFWQNRALPYLELWPQENDKLTQEIAESFAEVCVAARSAFPEALNRLESWLKPLRNNSYLLDELSRNQITKNFPEDSLRFLNLVTDEDSSLRFTGHFDYLRTCLQDIQEANPSLSSDNRSQKLWDLLRSAGEDPG